MPVLLASKSLLPYVSNELTEGPLKPITYQSGDGEVEGYAAEALPEICNIWLQARQDGALNPQLQPYDAFPRSAAVLGYLVCEHNYHPSARQHPKGHLERE